MHATSSRLFIVKNTWGFAYVMMLAHIAVLNSIHHTCHFPDDMQQTPLIPMKEESFDPIHVRGVWFYLSCIVGYFCEGGNKVPPWYIIGVN